VRQTTPASIPLHSPLSAAHTAGCPVAVSASPTLHQLPSAPFPQPSSGIDSQQYPPISKQLITGSCSCQCPHLSNVSVGCQYWLLHTLLQNSFFQGKGLTPLRSQGSPLRSDPCGTITLDFFHPFVIQQLSGLSPKDLLFYFLLIPLG
jgi:hypothetical protein